VGGYDWRREACQAAEAVMRARDEVERASRHQLPREVTERLLRVTLHLGSAQEAMSRLKEIKRT